jgi:GNAT superfamily N-acetyltransferase
MEYTIGIADIQKDRDSVIALWQRNFDNVPAERYAWIYENNPAGKAICLLARLKQNGRVIGASVLFPRNLQMNGATIKAAIIGDFAVDKEYRTHGLGLELRKASRFFTKNNVFQMGYGFPNDQSVRFTAKIDSEILGEIFELTKVLRTQVYFERYISNALLSKFTSLGADIFMNLRDRALFYSQTHSYTYELPSRFDERFDHLWNQVRHDFAFIGERDSRFLTWRFLESPYAQYRIFAIKPSHEAHLHGFIVFRDLDNKVMIDDLVFLGNNQSLMAIIVLFARYIRSQGAHSMTLRLAAHPRLIALLKRLGFLVRKNEQVIFKSPWSPITPAQQDPQQRIWYMTYGDNDI